MRTLEERINICLRPFNPNDTELLDEIIAKLAALRRDCAYYEWVKDPNHTLVQVSNDTIDNGKWYTIIWDSGGPGTKYTSPCFDTPDAAIDDAIAQEGDDESNKG